MTFPAPCPPWSARQRLRVREVRRGARRRVARLLARLAEQLDPPARVRERAVVAEGIAQGRADLQLVHGARATDDLVEWHDARRTRVLRARRGNP